MRITAELLLVGCLLFAACKKSQPQPETPAPPDSTLQNQKIILKIADISYSNGDLKEFIRLHYSSISGSETDSSMLSLLLQNFLNQKLVLYAANREGISTNDEEVGEYLKRINVGANEGNPNSKEMHDSVKIQKFLSVKAYNDIEVSEAELEKYYKENLDEFKKTEEIYLHQILLDNREKALRIRGELEQAPSRFEEVARRESKSMEAASGGKMGFFEKGQLPTEMENVVFSLKIGAISPVVESPYGFHIFKVSKRRYAKTLSYFQVKNEIREKLLSQKTGIAYQMLLQRLKSEIPVQIFKENIYFPYRENQGDIT